MLTKDGHFLSTLQITDEQTLKDLFKTAKIFGPVANGSLVTRILDGLVAASLFFEPSTRTRLSFEAAVSRLGGKPITVTGAGITSVAKGESYSDTARVVSEYSDLIILRTSSSDITNAFVSGSHRPVINGGSGDDEHPTQALLDVYTAEEELRKRGKKLRGSSIALIGDLKHSRAIHSLIKLLRLYSGITLHLLSPADLDLPEHLKKVSVDSGHSVVLHNERDLVSAISDADVLYTTRLQRERLGRNQDTGPYPSHLRLDADIVDRHAKGDTIIMHPLPRDSREGSNDLPFPHNDARLVAFRQAGNGVPIRMALISKMLSLSDESIKASLRPAPWPGETLTKGTSRL